MRPKIRIRHLTVDLTGEVLWHRPTRAAGAWYHRNPDGTARGFTVRAPGNRVVDVTW